MTNVSLGSDFYDRVKRLEKDALKLRWYRVVIVNLAAINYPDVIPEVWGHCWQNICEPLNHDGRFAVARTMREALTKGCGIMGPAKVVQSPQPNPSPGLLTLYAGRYRN